MEIHKKQFKPLPCHRILNVLEELKSIPSEYRVYAIYGECAYPVTDVKVITPECGVINIFFERTCRKVPSKACTTIQLSNKIKQLMKQFQIGIDAVGYLSLASDQGMQMRQVYEIKCCGMDDNCHIVFLGADNIWEK